VQAFQSLVRPLLSKSDAELSRAVSRSSGTKALLPTILLKAPFKVTAVGASAAALAAIVKGNPDELRSIVESQLTLAGGGSRLQQSAAVVLGALDPPVGSKAVVDTLLKLAASDEGEVQDSAVAALAEINPSDSDQRKAVVATLMKLAMKSLKPEAARPL
jgi:hypothetical protein